MSARPDEDLPFLKLQNTGLNIPHHISDPFKLKCFLSCHPRPSKDCAVVDFHPRCGYAGSLVVIVGAGFSVNRAENVVRVGTKPALVVAAQAHRLVVVCDKATKSGSVSVSVKGHEACAKCDFTVLCPPDPTSGLDGPPISFEGTGPCPVEDPRLNPKSALLAPGGSAGAPVTTRMLVVVGVPNDQTATATLQQDIIDLFQNVSTYYDQVSYGKRTIRVDVSTPIGLANPASYYQRASGKGYPNIDKARLGELFSECASGVQSAMPAFDANDYDVMCACPFMPGFSVRGWGNIDSNDYPIGTTNVVGLITLSTAADWGRAAHETGHFIIDGPKVGIVEEDIYSSDGVSPEEASAQQFDLMGNHDSHPMFSAYFMDQQGWYESNNVLSLNWSSARFSRDVDVVAHGGSENTDSSRFHVIKIKIAEGLHYFVEVRQKPLPNTILYDTNIPTPASDAGVVVTKVVDGLVNNNFRIRFLTLLQTNTSALAANETAIDPARNLKITVLNDNVADRPRVCRVRVEWNQEVTGDPNGKFDLRIAPWDNGPNWETVDIWVDRLPYGTFDNQDAAGNAVGNGDKPEVGKVNHFEARIHNDGTVDATDVQVTHYAINPPGVGDNGTWTPLRTKTIPRIAANAFGVSSIDWTPRVGEHTCLKVEISKQLGEMRVNNNVAQENVFQFDSAASSVPEPIELTVAVRNPLRERTEILLAVYDVPRGYHVHFPNRSVWLDPLAERILDLLVIPIADFHEMPCRRANVKIKGLIPHEYADPLPGGSHLPSLIWPIGGIRADVTVKNRSTVVLRDDIEAIDGPDVVRVDGTVTPPLPAQRIRVDVTRPDQSVAVQEVETDRTGAFSAILNLKGQVDVPGILAVLGTATAAAAETYSFQAHIFNATELAAADSNVVFYRVEAHEPPK